MQVSSSNHSPLRGTPIHYIDPTEQIIVATARIVKLLRILMSKP
jgi:hypothetical protein